MDGSAYPRADFYRTHFTPRRVAMAGEHLDLSSEERPNAATDDSRPFVGIRFACCDAYARVYRNREATAYVGHCPRCLKRVELKVAPGGSEARFFTAY